jgi:hypothetical protein
MSNKGYALLNMGNYPNALRVFLAGLQIAEDKQSEKRLIPAELSVCRRGLCCRCNA